MQNINYNYIIIHCSGLTKKTQANVNATSGVPGNAKSGPVQVIFNGKIVTPQSLIPRKSATSSNQAEGPRKLKSFGKPQTIDEVASESADRATPGFPSKANMKRYVKISVDSVNNFNYLCILPF